MHRTAIAGFLLLLAATASAQQPEDADTYFRQGNTFYKEQRWGEARGAYETAWRLKKSHDIAANLAYAEMKLGKFRDAAEHLAFAVKNWPPTGKADKRDYAIERLQLVKKEVGALSIRVSAARAEVLVDGKAIGQSPLDAEVFVEPGSHTVEAKLGGYEDAKEVVEAAKGSALTVTLALVAVVPPPATGTAVAPPPPAARGPNKAIAITGAAITGVGAGLGVVLAVVSNGKASDSETLRSALISSNGPAACTGAHVPASCSAVQDAIRGKNTFGSAAAWSFIGAGAVGAATLIYVLATPRAAKTGGVVIAPMVAAKGGGLVLGGAWQ